MTMTCEDWLRQENEQLQADLAAAQRELAAWKQAINELRGHREENRIVDWIGYRVDELLAQEGVVVAMTTPNVISNVPPTAQPQYREPTLEDAQDLYQMARRNFGSPETYLIALKQLNFVRKVQP